MENPTSAGVTPPAAVNIPARRLRPMAVGDIIDEAIQLYRRHIKLFLTIGAIVYIPVGIIQTVVQLIFQNSDDLDAFVIVTLVSGLITFAAYLAMSGAMIHATNEAWYGRDTTLNDAWSVGFSQMWRILGLGLIFFFALFFISITIIGIPFAIYLFFAWIFAFAALVIERTGIRSSLGRSRALVRGHWWRVLGIFIVVSLIQGVISTIFSLPGAIAGAGTVITDPNADPSAAATILSSLGSTLGTIVTLPIAYCSYILLYYDHRIRNEGFDLELGAQQVEATAPPRATPGLTF